jgi:hypothetical protein
VPLPLRAARELCLRHERENSAENRASAGSAAAGPAVVQTYGSRRLVTFEYNSLPEPGSSHEPELREPPCESKRARRVRVTGDRHALARRHGRRTFPSQPRRLGAREHLRHGEARRDLEVSGVRRQRCADRAERSLCALPFFGRRRPALRVATIGRESASTALALTPRNGMATCRVETNEARRPPPRLSDHFSRRTRATRD